MGTDLELKAWRVFLMSGKVMSGKNEFEDLFKM